MRVLSIIANPLHILRVRNLEHPPSFAFPPGPAAAPAAGARVASVELPQDAPADHNDQQDTESQAASDVAVAGRPEKGKCKSRKRSRNDSVETARDQPAVLTYPHPKNFAERLMSALQANLAPECLGWAEEGAAVWLNQKHLKRGIFLSTHFHISNVGAFIRNFNRW